jgi:hypothetical protein
MMEAGIFSYIATAAHLQPTALSHFVFALAHVTHAMALLEAIL